MTKNNAKLFNLRPCSRRIIGISGRYIMLTHIAEANITVIYQDGTTRILQIDNILYFSELNYFLLSWKSLKLKGSKDMLGNVKAERTMEEDEESGEH
jgi:hypothetical protein